jgi:hypothetical protein
MKAKLSPNSIQNLERIFPQRKKAGNGFLATLK